MEHEQSCLNGSGTNLPYTQSMPMNFYGNNNIVGVGVGVGQQVYDQVVRKPQVIMDADAMEHGNSHWHNHHLSGSSQVPWWVLLQQQQHMVHQEPAFNQNYVQYLPENSGLVCEPDVISDSLPSLPSEISYDVPRVSDFHPDFHFNNYLGQICGLPSNQLGNAWNVQYNQDLELQAQQPTLSQTHYPWMLNSNGESSYCNVSQVETPSARSVGSPPKPRSRASSARAKVTDRQRRIRITEKLAALQTLLPNSGEGCQASILDDVIDMVKYLQLQIKELCRSKTESQCQSTTVPLIFREGYGHYFVDQQGLNEPLEEMLGKLLEQNPSEAAQLLQMKGLFLMPIEFAQRLS